MGKQFGFLMDRDDEKKFFEYLISNYKIHLQIPHQSIKRIFSLPNENWFNLYINNDASGNLNPVEYDSDKFMIFPVDSPVVEFRQTFVRDEMQEMTRGRLFVEMHYWKNNELVKKESALEEIFKQCVRWIKKNLRCVELQKDGNLKKEYASESLVKKIISGYHILG